MLFFGTTRCSNSTILICVTFVLRQARTFYIFNNAYVMKD